jgi:hypothetical protein
MRKHSFANKDLRPETKARLYSALVLGILLYGCETWFLREKEFKKIQRFHHDCVRTMLRVNRNQQYRRKIPMSKLFADLDHRVRPLRWHYETRLLRWGGHIVRMEKDRLPRMLMTSWVPNSRPIGCPRMTFGRTVKKALKRLPDMWPNLPFDRPENWDSLSDAAQEALLKAHGVKKRTHDVEMQTHWMTIAQDREAWKEIIRGPEPERTSRARTSRSRRSRTQQQQHHHHHQPQPQQPVVFQQQQQQHQQAGHFNDINGQVVHRHFDD